MLKSFPILGGYKESEFYNPDELIDLFLKCTADAIAIVDMGNRFIRINEMYTKIFGYTEEDIIGRCFDEFNTPKEVLGIIESVKGGTVITNLITQRFHKDGTELDIAVSYSPFRNISGQIIAIIAIFRDVTEQKRMERELNRTRELYKLITENATDLIAVVTKELKVIYASPSFETVVGINPDELVDRNVKDLIMSDNIEEYFDVVNQVISTGEPQLLKNRIKSRKDDDIYTDFTVSPIYNTNREFDSFVVVGRNVTDRVKNEATIRNLDRLSIIGQLAAGVAHEIRNPLTALKGFSKLMQDNPNLDKREDYLSIIMTELNRIDMIVNEFMSLAKPQAVKYERNNIITIIDSTIQVLHPQAMLHNVEFELNYTVNQVDVFSNAQQLKQVFVNFIKNAIESMAFGGKIKINLSLTENSRVIVTITDEGVGIEKERLRFLGTPFYTTKDKGIGLGLTVSNKIIQEHNGTMVIESKKEEGTKVTVELPCT
ncbi:PAS domain S-box protein [Bacillus luteolus]|uniref:histidine kinase n=1 Tax=Litchfieldia luteola TaxID=682179 RepID=A0ABR9QQ73_9BACI|nr:PAS domain S-box protein [Cytobacillus luteolus]MBE4910653.1 PAS domain S-box protein [Cytobacillus luteolus]MBP1943832.1 two-component system sporulation sensor kinase A [Cytobacillus luteolus]